MRGGAEPGRSSGVPGHAAAPEPAVGRPRIPTSLCGMWVVATIMLSCSWRQTDQIDKFIPELTYRRTGRAALPLLNRRQAPAGTAAPWTWYQMATPQATCAAPAFQEHAPLCDGPEPGRHLARVADDTRGAVCEMLRGV